MVFFSGHVPWEQTVDGEAKTVADGDYKFVGKISYLPAAGANVTHLSIQDGQAAQQLCVKQILSQLNHKCQGELGRVVSIMRLGVHVNCDPSFTDLPKVANGASDLLIELFGPTVGSHVRLAVGAVSLPRGVAVEVEAIVIIDSCGLGLPHAR